MEFIEVEVLKWGTHQRKDVKKPSWFALDNRILEDAKLFGLTDGEWKALLYIFCQASQQHKSSAVRLSLSHAKRVCEIQEKTIRSALEKLDHVGVTRTLRGRHAHVTPQDRTRQDKTGQDTAPANALAVAKENPVSFYCDEYKARYGHNPPIAPKQAGILTKFSKDHPGKWQTLIRGYLQMPDSWAVARSHPVELLSSKLNEIVRYLETGKVVTKKVAQHTEDLVDQAQGTLRKPRKSLDELEREKAEMLAQAEIKAIGGRS